MSPFIAVLRHRMQQLGETTKAIRVSVLIDDWYFRTDPPPEAKVIGTRWVYGQTKAIDTSKWEYRCAPRTPEFCQQQG